MTVDSKPVPPGTPPPSPPPGGPTGPQPTGPQPSGPPLTGNTGSPWPSRPGGPSGPGGPTAPPKSDAELLSRIDDTLVALLAMTYFGPAEQGTAAAVNQVAAAEVLLFRLRMARRAVADLRAAYESPARQSPQLRPSGGPVNVPGSRLRGPGEEGCADGAVSAAFRLPDTRVPLVFEPGERRLYGRVEPLPEAVGVGYDDPPPSDPRSLRDRMHCPAGQLIELGHCGCEGCARLCSECAAVRS